MNAQTSLNILLVEDHADSRNAMKRWLEFKGHVVLVAGDKKTACALAAEQPVDLLICDLQLPDGDGCELMKQLSAQKPILGIVSSGHGAQADIAKSKAVGFFDHLVKPYTVEELDAAIARVLQEINRRDGVRPDSVG